MFIKRKRLLIVQRLYFFHRYCFGGGETNRQLESDSCMYVMYFFSGIFPLYFSLLPLILRNFTGITFYFFSTFAQFSSVQIFFSFFSSLFICASRALFMGWERASDNEMETDCRFMQRIKNFNFSLKLFEGINRTHVTIAARRTKQNDDQRDEQTTKCFTKC